MAPPILEFGVSWNHFDVAWGHFDVAWQKLWHENDVFDEILGCAGHLTLPKNILQVCTEGGLMVPGTVRRLDK